MSSVRCPRKLFVLWRSIIQSPLSDENRVLLAAVLACIAGYKDGPASQVSARLVGLIGREDEATLPPKS